MIFFLSLINIIGLCLAYSEGLNNTKKLNGGWYGRELSNTTKIISYTEYAPAVEGMFELLVSPIKSRAVDWDVVHSLYTERKAHEPAREEPQSWDEFVKILALDETVLEATARTTVSRKTFRVHYDDFPWWKHLKNIWGDSSIRIWLEKCYVKVTFSSKYLTGLISYLSGIGLPGQGEACSEFVYYESYNGENWIISIILTTTDDKGTCDTKPSKDDIANIVKEADANLNENGIAAYCTRSWQGENWQGEVRVAADSPDILLSKISC